MLCSLIDRVYTRPLATNLSCSVDALVITLRPTFDPMRSCWIASPTGLTQWRLIFSVGQKRFADRKAPGGCFLASHLGDESVDVEIKADLQRLAKSRLSVVVKRLARARDENQLSIDTNVPALANVVLCFLAGMSAMARTGASPQQFSGAIATFMQLLRSISINH